jgi:hypothetical protein
VPGVLDRRATTRGGMHRRPNPTVIMKWATKPMIGRPRSIYGGVTAPGTSRLVGENPPLMSDRACRTILVLVITVGAILRDDRKH